jgi:phytanoyl-CoA hydroxylase
MNNKQHFAESGYRKFKNVVHPEELTYLRALYDDFLNNKYDLTGHRGDLSGDTSANKKVEKITQIMRPALIVNELLHTKTYQKVFKIAKELMGDDIEMDFDMLIDKAPGTDTKTPWHQDAAYWPNMEDKRALSFWIALDDADQENGCMMYVHGSHQRPILPHSQPKPNAALQCEVSDDDDIVYGEIPSGDAIVHHGYTLHAALGNKSSDRHRRALIINLRPKAMIDYLRNLGYDHLGKREIKNKV